MEIEKIMTEKVLGMDLYLRFNLNINSFYYYCISIDSNILICYFVTVVYFNDHYTCVVRDWFNTEHISMYKLFKKIYLIAFNQPFKEVFNAVHSKRKVTSTSVSKTINFLFRFVNTIIWMYGVHNAYGWQQLLIIHNECLLNPVWYTLNNLSTGRSASITYINKDVSKEVTTSLWKTSGFKKPNSLLVLKIMKEKIMLSYGIPIMCILWFVIHAIGAHHTSVLTTWNLHHKFFVVIFVIRIIQT